MSSLQQQQPQKRRLYKSWLYRICRQEEELECRQSILFLQMFYYHTIKLSFPFKTNLKKKHILKWDFLTLYSTPVYILNLLPSSLLPNTTITIKVPSFALVISVDLMKYWVRSIGPRYLRPSSTSSINSPLLPSGSKTMLQVWVSKGYQLKCIILQLFNRFV